MSNGLVEADWGQVLGHTDKAAVGFVVPVRNCVEVKGAGVCAAGM
jgi:hypothetical protein